MLAGSIASPPLIGEAGAIQVSPRCAVVASAPLMLHTGDGRPVYVEAPTGHGTARSFTAIGAPAWEWFGKTSLLPHPAKDSVDSLKYARLLARDIRRFGFRVDSTGLAIPIRRATSERDVHRPTLVHLRGRAPALLWLERVGDPPSSSVTLWHATEVDRYAMARQVWAGSQLSWDESQVAYAAARGVALIVVPFVKAGIGSGLLFIRLDDRGVHVREVLRDGLPDHAAVVSQDDSGTRWRVVYSASDTKSGVSNGSHLFSASFSRDGQLVDEKRLQWSGLDHASHPLLSRIGTSRELRLAWTLSRSTSPLSDSLAAWTSRDLGASWQAVDQVGLPGRVVQLTAVQIGSVPVYAAFLSGRPDTSLSVVAQLPGGLSIISLPAVAASAPQWIELDQDAALLWGVAREDVQGGRWPHTEMTRVALRCTP